MLTYFCGVPIPLFIIYELVTRIHQIDPSIGTYVSHQFNTSGAVILTSNRTIRIRTALLNRQFKDPELITATELSVLLKPAVAKITRKAS